MRSEGMEQARKQAIDRIMNLSPCALEYILKAIEWAYNWTDGHDQDSMSDEDSSRYMLIAAALHDSVRVVELLNTCRRAFVKAELKKDNH